MSAIFKREMSAYFSSATAYVVMAVFFFFSGMFFNFYVFAQNSNSLTYVFSNMFFIIMFLIPIITMKSFAEEKKQKSDQALLTSPCLLTEIVLGKFLSAFILFTICNLIFSDKKKPAEHQYFLFCTAAVVCDSLYSARNPAARRCDDRY